MGLQLTAQGRTYCWYRKVVDSTPHDTVFHDDGSPWGPEHMAVRTGTDMSGVPTACLAVSQNSQQRRGEAWLKLNS